MYFYIQGYPIEGFRVRCKQCLTNTCTLICVTLAFVFLIIFFAILAVNLNDKVVVLYIRGTSPKFVTDDKFLSVALDTSLIATDFKNFRFKNLPTISWDTLHVFLTKPSRDPKLRKTLEALAPAYLRIGGTMADRLTFATSLHFKHSSKEIDGAACAYEQKKCDYLDRPNFTMNAKEWLDLSNLAQATGLKIVFDLNALKRFDNGSWDYTNAEKLINFSNAHNLDVDWELGNEPDAYFHQFNYEVPPSQMAKDFHTLKTILEKYPKYKSSLLVGPDVTRPQEKNYSMNYLQDFFNNAKDVISAVTWHQYYFNGATATVINFLDPATFDVLQWQINVVKSIVGDGKIWLGETSSAYGGGAKHLSNRFIATFLWLDKLGLAAKNGLSVVVRQSFFQGYYALISNHYNPNPDWWVSVLYKKLVSKYVVNCNMPQMERLRLYCHCTKRGVSDVPSVTIFGVNFSRKKRKIRFEGVTALVSEMKSLKVDSYILTTYDRIDSRFIYLNGELLQLTDDNDVPKLIPKTENADPYVEMPAYSLAFWVVPIRNNALSFC